jgi:hypothetical protein
MLAAILLLAGCASAPSAPPAAVVDFAGIDPDDATQVIATGTVTGLEPGGRCVFTFWAASGAATRLSKEGSPDGNSVACGPVKEGIGFMVGGSYEVELKYVPVEGEEIVSERIPMSIPKPTTLNP